MTDHENELDRLRKENDLLRGLMPALGAPCVYCGEKDISRCARGFPGCPQADDLMIGQDETGKRLITELDQLRRQKEALREALEDCERVLRLSPPTISGRDFNRRGDAIRKAQAALSDTAGSDYISKESVKPLVEALQQGFRDFDALITRGDFADDDTPHAKRTRDKLKCALAHAKSIGIPTETEGT